MTHATPRCAFVLNGTACRKPETHQCHQAHDADCRIRRAHHHDFVPPRPYGQDTTRTTVFLAPANKAHAEQNGGISACINRLLTIDRCAANGPIRITSIEDAGPTKRTKRK